MFPSPLVVAVRYRSTVVSTSPLELFTLRFSDLEALLVSMGVYVTDSGAVVYPEALSASPEAQSSRSGSAATPKPSRTPSSRSVRSVPVDERSLEEGRDRTPSRVSVSSSQSTSASTRVFSILLSYTHSRTCGCVERWCCASQSCT